MNVKLAYGKCGLDLTLPDDADVTVVAPTFMPGIPDPREALRAALARPIASPPLYDLAAPGQTVAIVFSDITRPTPNHLILPAVLEALSHVPDAHITLCNALGTHRPNTEAELRGMLGDAIVDRYRIVQNDAFDPDTQVCLGQNDWGHDIWINRAFMEAEVKILTGFVEPHFFAGFSGGGKAVMPGMAGLRTVLGNHDACMIGNAQATWGVTWGNPIWEEARAVALHTNPAFIVNVALNRDKAITGVFAGALDAAHQAGIEFVRGTNMVPIDTPFDIVIGTNSGYPLDLNLYQTVKGMSAACEAVRDGGAIIIASACWDGIPDHGLYGELLRAAKDPHDLLERIFAFDAPRQDQWEAHVQARVQLKAEVHVYSDHLTPQQIAEALLEPCTDIPATVERLRNRFGRDARICVMPEGPQTVPYLDSGNGRS